MVLMRHYIGDSHARAQTTFAMMLSENNERLAGGEIGGEMTPYYRLSQSIPAYRRPISEQEGLEYSPPPQTAYVEGRIRIARPETVNGVGEAGGALAAGEGANADASLVTTAAAWDSEQLRMYETEPVPQRVAGGGGAAGVGAGGSGGGVPGAVDDYVVAGGARREDPSSQQTDGMLPSSFNTWRPAGVLCAHLHEHMGAIIRLLQTGAIA